MGDQVVAPPSMPAVEPVEVPAWAAAPEMATEPGSSREEAIAEVLRAALARGHSDDALTGILRKVLDGASPQAALAEPELSPPTAELVLPDDVVAVPPRVTPVHPEPATDEQFLEPAPFVEPFSVSEPLPAVDIWGAPTSAPLWGEAVTVAPTARTDAPIWAEVGRGGQGPTTVVEPVDEWLDQAPVADAPNGDDTLGTDGVEVGAELAAEMESDVEADAEQVAEAEFEQEIEQEIEQVVEELAPLLARTASDPAPFAGRMSMSLDSTSVMPPLSLLPPLPSSRGRGRPPVPPATSRPPVPPSRPALDPATTEVEEVVVPAPVTAPATLSLATVTRLPVAPLMAGPEMPELEELESTLPATPLVDVWEPETLHVPEPEVVHVAEPEVLHVAEPEVVHVTEPEVVEAPAPAIGTEPVLPATGSAPETAEVADDVVERLAALGVPSRLLGSGFAGEVERHGLYAALTRALGLRLPAAPQLPTGAGEVLFVVGPGVETLRAARRIAASLCLDPDRVQWATCGDLANLAPGTNRVTTVDGAMARRQDAAHAGTVTIVAVDAPMRTDAYWMRQMLAIWSPVAVWAVVEATRKPEDVEPWLDAMARVDALIVTDTDLSADPAAVLHRVAAPVAVLDGIRATPHRWASLLCERLEGAEA